MERFGRRWPLIIGGLWQSIWLFVFASVGTAKDPATDPAIGNVMIVSACLFIFGYAMTWGPGIWILIGESFPTRTRAKQAALSTASNWLWNFLLVSAPFSSPPPCTKGARIRQAFFTSFITADIGYAYGFIFAGCNLAGAIVVFLFVYESSDLSLEGVDQMYNDPSVKAWTSGRWAPAGYTSRHDLVSQTKAAEAQKPLANGGTGMQDERLEKAPRNSTAANDSTVNGGRPRGDDA
jgi:SP family sugar:H+ symporter-like MFS transporter